MTGSTHLMAGVVCGAVLSLNMPTPAAKGVVIASAVIGSLFPDIDHPNSKISHKIPILPKIISLACGHRGIIHSPILYLPLLLVFVLVQNNLIRLGVLGFLVGVLSHLVLDTLNPTGIPWLYPLTKKKFHLLSIKTGALGEKCFFFVLLLLAGASVLFVV